MRDIKRQNPRNAFVAASISLLLVLGLTWPVCISPFELLVGHPGNDTWNHVWGYWWVGQALQSGQWPFIADGLAFPDGGTLYFIDTVQAILSWPFNLFLGLFLPIILWSSFNWHCVDLLHGYWLGRLQAINSLHLLHCLFLKRHLIF